MYSSSTDDGKQDFNVRTEPKFIVFLKQLLLSFHVCQSGKADGLLAEWITIGTLVEITTICANPTCKEKTRVWQSQPVFSGTKIPAGNFLVRISTGLGHLESASSLGGSNLLGSWRVDHKLKLSG